MKEAQVQKKLIVAKNIIISKVFIMIQDQKIKIELRMKD